MDRVSTFMIVHSNCYISYWYPFKQVLEFCELCKVRFGTDVPTKEDIERWLTSYVGGDDIDGNPYPPAKPECIKWLKGLTRSGLTSTVTILQNSLFQQVEAMVRSTYSYYITKLRCLTCPVSLWRTRKKHGRN